MSRELSPQNVRVAARSRVLSSRRDAEALPDPEDWLPSEFRVVGTGDSGGLEVAHEAEAVPANPPAAAELGAEVQRLRRELDTARAQAVTAGDRAERAEREVGRLQERVEQMKRAAAEAAANTHPEDPAAS